MYLKVKSKKEKNLIQKISKEKNELVIKVLHKKGYTCNNTIESQKEISKKLNLEQRKVILENQNEKLSKIGSYYIWEADVTIKIVDVVTGKEV